jgi:acetate kinase
VEVNRIRSRCEDTDASVYEHALDELVKVAISEGVLTRAEDITRIGIRIVSPGAYFQEHRVIDGGYRERLSAMRDAAPLHIPHELEELDAALRLFPHACIVGASDSAFHRTMEEYAHLYGIPRADADAFEARRFGYHGLSVASVVRKLTGFISTLPERLIVCHIGSGVSVTAVREGTGADTTMGFGPASGLMMNTRAGDLDPAGLLYLMKKKDLDAEEMERYVSEESGLKGLVGASDLRVLIEKRERGDRIAAAAFTKYVAGIAKAAAGMAVTLGGVDAIVLTGTVSERNAMVRGSLAHLLSPLGLHLDEELNEALMEREGKVSVEGSPIALYVVRTDEMGEIVRVTENI